MSKASIKLRKNKIYYLKELKTNAKRSREKAYHKKPTIKEQAYQLRLKRKKKAGYYPKRKWTIFEINYITEKYKKTDYLLIALKLERSLVSIEKKIVRLKLKKYHRWKKE